MYQDDDSRFLSNNLLLLHNGITRNNITVHVDGQNAETIVGGLAIGDKTQKIDNYVSMNHLKPNSTSSKLFGIYL